MTPEEFIRLNLQNFGSPYEKLFVERVVAHTGVDLSLVTCQTSFLCDGKNRRCDFTFEDGIRIAIEVDGYDKTGRGDGMTRAEFVYWLHKQNCLQEQGWTVLRFANAQVMRQPKRCARNIELGDVSSSV